MKEQSTSRLALLITIPILLVLFLAGGAAAYFLILPDLRTQTSPSDQSAETVSEENLGTWLGTDTVLEILTRSDSSQPRTQTSGKADSQTENNRTEEILHSQELVDVNMTAESRTVIDPDDEDPMGDNNITIQKTGSAASAPKAAGGGTAGSKEASAKTENSRQTASKTTDSRQTASKTTDSRQTASKTADSKQATSRTTDSKTKDIIQKSYAKNSTEPLTKLQKQYISEWEFSHGRDFPDGAPLHNYNWKYLKRDENGVLQYKGDENYTVRRGIDVSEFQGNIDWDAVLKAGCDFAFIRVGYRMFETGDLREDSRAIKNLTRAKKAGLDVGVYVFSQAISKKEAREEAQLCLDMIKKSGVDITLPIVFDPEIQINYYARINYITAEQFTDNAIAFCEKIHESGYTPAIYANSSTMTDIFDMERICKETDVLFWYADYYGVPETPYQFTFWQYTDLGLVNGIPETNTDLNLWFIKKEPEKAEADKSGKTAEKEKSKSSNQGAEKSKTTSTDDKAASKDGKADSKDDKAADKTDSKVDKAASKDDKAAPEDNKAADKTENKDKKEN